MAISITLTFVILTDTNAADSDTPSQNICDYQLFPFLYEYEE